MTWAIIALWVFAAAEIAATIFYLHAAHQHRQAHRRLCDIIREETEWKQSADKRKAEHWDRILQYIEEAEARYITNNPQRGSDT